MYSCGNNRRIGGSTQILKFVWLHVADFLGRAAPILKILDTARLHIPKFVQHQKIPCRRTIEVYIHHPPVGLKQKR